MKRKNVSKRLSYGNLFDDWELQIARALVWDFAYRWPFAADEFDDLLQEVLTHWCFARDTYDAGEAASRKTYMRRIVLRKLLDLSKARKSAKRKMLDKAECLDEPIGKGADAKTLGETTEDTRRTSTDHRIGLSMDLDSIAANVTSRQRTVLALKIEGLNNVEIARSVGVSRDTIQTEVQRLRRLFEEAGLKDYLG